MYTYELLGKDELKKQVYGDDYYPKLEEELKHAGNQPVFKGFFYFNADHLIEYNWGRNSEPMFLVARAQGVESPFDIVGVLKLGSYEEGKDIPYFAINYIDVKEDHKKRGIATNLIRHLNDILAPTDLLVGTGLSIEG